MIYDSFLFFNELELLKIRMNYLSDVVDKFVVVEATTTFSGNPKPLYFEKNKEMFDKWKDKIIHSVVEIPQMDAWSKEYYHRNQLMRDIPGDPNDVIILSDVDEIPSIEGILQNKDIDGMHAFFQKRYDYFLNYFYFDGWHGPNMAKRKYIHSPQMHRRSSYHHAIQNGGWHFSHLGGYEAVKLKLQSFSHQECNTPEIMNNLDEMCKTGLSYYLHHGPVRTTIDEDLPQIILSNVEYYKNIGYIGEMN